MRDPGAVMPIGCFATLILADLLQRLFVRDGIALNRDVSSHAAHGKSAALMAGLDARERVGPHERGGHRHLRSVRNDKLLFAGKLLDVTEDVVPAPAV